MHKNACWTTENFIERRENFEMRYKRRMSSQTATEVVESETLRAACYVK